MNPRWEGLLEELPEGLDGLAQLEWLRRHVPAEEARQLAELAQARRRARGKLREPDKLWLSRKGLEQATNRRVAEYRAHRFAMIARDEWVTDGTAGIGGDALELVRAGVRLRCVERDPHTARLLRANLASIPECTTEVVEGELQELAPQDMEWLFVDPDRRTGDRPGGPRAGPRRSLDPARWSPAWDGLLPLLSSCKGACVKLPPALVPSSLGLPDELRRSFEWISVDGELKELCLWTGALAGPGGRRAVILRGDQLEVHTGVVDREVPALDPDAAVTIPYLADPDPALIAAGLLGAFAYPLAAAPLASDLGYLGLNKRPDRLPLAASFYAVLDSVPLDRKRVRAMLNEHGIGPLVVKKRGLSESSDELAARMKGKGKAQGLVIAARLDPGRRVFLVRKLEK